MALNGLSARIRVHEASVEEAPSLLSSGSVDVIVCNPPYGMPGATLHNPGPVSYTHLDVYKRQVHVYIEYYLNGVLPYEMGDSAPLEALKAQAVRCV